MIPIHLTPAFLMPESQLPLPQLSGSALNRLGPAPTAAPLAQPGSETWLVGLLQMLASLMQPKPQNEARPQPQPQNTKQKTGAPPGYKTMKGQIPAGVVARAKGLLSQPMGTEVPFELEGRRYMARLEPHYHPPGYQGGPNGWHKGVSVYEAT